MKIRECDILTDGTVRLYRQRTDLPFLADNTLCIEAIFENLADIKDALDIVEAQERKEALRYPFAWNPEFGYITSRPRICGTGLCIHGLFHLEGLSLIGDLPPVLDALKALRMNVEPMSGEGIKEAAHVFHVRNGAMLGITTEELAKRIKKIFAALIREETNARIRLVEELPRVLDDSICRALAAIKSCRLLSEWELLDVLSPLTLAAEMNFLTGLTATEAKKMMRLRLDMPEQPKPQTYDDERMRDHKDAQLADKMNQRFKNVCLNAHAKDLLRS